MFHTSLRSVPPVVEVPGFPALDVPDTVACLDDLARRAGALARTFPAALYETLVDFGDDSGDAGAVVLRPLPLGDLPPTPPTPTTATSKSWASEALLLAAARRLGQPVGYAPEHGGDLVQNIVPVASSASRQISTSSRATLMFHTETAFHPFRPRYLLLLCLRGDPAARTTLAASPALVRALPTRHRRVLFEPRFRTAVDESHRPDGRRCLGAPRPVFEGPSDRPVMVFDADLMVGIDGEATAALAALADIVEEHHTSVVLEAGDLLVVDNYRVVHGRSSFTPRFDGTDRWLQRTFVISDLATCATVREGRVLASA